ncbi:MAG: hypothetical protein WCV86_03630 [Patescibacteria group bacterium]|jgi:disulfide bond formation protein DsbB
MTSRPFFLLILYFSVLGSLLSGYLSYNTLFRSEGCGQALITCGEKPVEFFGVSQCIYGFIFFVIVLVVSILGLTMKDRAKKLMSLEVYLGIAGTLFAGGLSYYELWIQTPKPMSMPSCVYGFFLFGGVLLTAYLAKQALFSSTNNASYDGA